MTNKKEFVKLHPNDSINWSVELPEVLGIWISSLLKAITV